MESSPSLEQLAKALVEDYRRAKGEAASLRRQVLDQQRELDQLRQQNTELRKSMDVLNADRFVLKRLRDERKVVRRQVASALNRLEALSQEVGIEPES